MTKAPIPSLLLTVVQDSVASLMRAVGAKESQALTNYGDELSGWWLLWRKWNPFAPPPKIPDMEDIASRLAYISCNIQLNEV